MDTCVQKLSQLSFISGPQTEMEQFVCLFNYFKQNFCKALFFTMHTVLGNKKIGKTRVCRWVYGFILEQYMVILKSSNRTQKRHNVLILSWHQFEHFLPLLKCLFFLTLVIKADGDLQVFPDVGTSPDASDTGFEELMDVSDGN